MKCLSRVARLIPLFMGMLTVLFPITAHAGGYFLVDRDGRVISETSEKVIEIGSSGKRVAYHDGGTRVFDVEWDASKRTLVVKGDNVYLRIYSTGQIEKLTTIYEGEKQQMPIFVEPNVNFMPRQNPPRK
ncbi:MAG TPA: hypothetical protein VFG09_10345 [Thermodesulfovibrionales bacterium]|nr:hypothetical protein [Thermodesulfovibrionales bacterium]